MAPITVIDIAAALHVAAGRRNEGSKLVHGHRIRRHSEGIGYGDHMQRLFVRRGTGVGGVGSLLEAADRQLIARAHEHGIRIIGATLTPYQGSFYASQAGESVREALNHWIISSGEFDGVIDFALAVADPGNPQTIDRRYNETDHLHPNDAGYKVMGDAIDLSLIVK